MTPSFVVDASLAMAWCFPEEATKVTNELLDRMEAEAAAVPGWWFLEVTNVLALAERRGRLTPAQAAAFIALIESFEMVIDDQAPGRAFGHILPLCRAHRLTSYDAAYLELALRRQLPLASLDDNLRTAAKAAGVHVLGK